jgi:ABC-2 type transport system permease protein
MSEILGIYSIWLREVKRYVRERSRLVSSFTTPLLWLVIFGVGIGSGIGRFGTTFSFYGYSYQTFIFPGIIGQTLLFTAIWLGISLIWDREFGFLKEILVAPISRTSIVVGKALGGATSAFLQGLLLLPFSFVLGVGLTPFSFLACIPIMFLIALGLVTIGLSLAARIESLEGFNLIMSFVVMPMFFLSGALFPIDTLPQWLRIFTYLDPLTYGVDALRFILLNNASALPIYLDILVLIGFTISIILIAAREFNIKK